MTWPNSYPCVQDAAAVRSGEGAEAVSRLAWTAPACNQGRLSPESRGIRVAAVLGRWAMQLNVRHAGDVNLSASSGPRAGLNSGALWRLDYPQPKRKGRT